MGDAMVTFNLGMRPSHAIWGDLWCAPGPRGTCGRRFLRTGSVGTGHVRLRLLAVYVGTPCAVGEQVC